MVYKIMYCKDDYGDSSDTFCMTIKEDQLENKIKEIEETGCKVLSISKE